MKEPNRFSRQLILVVREVKYRGLPLNKVIKMTYTYSQADAVLMEYDLIRQRQEICDLNEEIKKVTDELRKSEREVRIHKHTKGSHVMRLLDERKFLPVEGPTTTLNLCAEVSFEKSKELKRESILAVSIKNNRETYQAYSFAPASLLMRSDRVYILKGLCKAITKKILKDE